MSQKRILEYIDKVEKQQQEVAKLKALLLKVLDRWWPFVHGQIASDTALNIAEEIRDAVQPPPPGKPCRHDFDELGFCLECDANFYCINYEHDWLNSFDLKERRCARCKVTMKKPSVLETPREWIKK